MPDSSTGIEAMKRPLEWNYLVRAHAGIERYGGHESFEVEIESWRPEAVETFRKVVRNEGFAVPYCIPDDLLTRRKAKVIGYRGDRLHTQGLEFGTPRHAQVWHVEDPISGLGLRATIPMLARKGRMAVSLGFDRRCLATSQVDALLLESCFDAVEASLRFSFDIDAAEEFRP